MLLQGHSNRPPRSRRLRKSKLSEEPFIGLWQGREDLKGTAQHGSEIFADGSGAVDVAQLILIDTDILIDAGRKVGEAIACLERVEQQATLGVSIVTQMETLWWAVGTKQSFVSWSDS